MSGRGNLKSAQYLSITDNNGRTHAVSKWEDLVAFARAATTGLTVLA